MSPAGSTPAIAPPSGPERRAVFPGRWAAGAAPTSAWHLRVEGDGPGDLRRARQAIADLARLGAMGPAVDDLVLAAHEVLARALRQSGGRAEVAAWYDGGTFVCEVGDAGPTERAAPGTAFPATAPEGDRALWMADRLCDGVEVHRTGAGTTVRLRRHGPRRAA